AVAVEVGPGGAGAPEPFGQTGLFGHIHEAPAALAVGLIAIEGHAAPTGDEQIRPAIAVVVADGAAVAVKDRLVEADLPGDVAEFAVAKVLVEPVAPALDLHLFGTVVVAAAGHDDIEEAVAIIIDEADAAAERFEDGVV